MKFDSIPWALGLALIAAIGNALYALGQKKSAPHENPFLFGTFALLAGTLLLGAVASLFSKKDIGSYCLENAGWFLISGSGYLLLNIGLYFLYRNFGASYYLLYAVLSIVTTSILLATLVFGEKMNLYFWIAVLFATLTVFFFFKGQAENQ